MDEDDLDDRMDDDDGGDMSEAAPSSGEPAARAPQRHAWSPEEDEKLRQLVAQHGPCEWGAIAAQMGTRKHWQCRERWHHHLTPELTRTEWTAHEDAIILHNVRSFGQVRRASAKHRGPRARRGRIACARAHSPAPLAARTLGPTASQQWSRFRAHLPGRSGHAIKNRYHSLKRRADRLRKQGRLGENDDAIPLGTPGGAPQLAGAAPPGGFPAQPPAAHWPPFQHVQPAAPAMPIAEAAGGHQLGRHPGSGHQLGAHPGSAQPSGGHQLGAHPGNNRPQFAQPAGGHQLGPHPGGGSLGGHRVVNSSGQPLVTATPQAPMQSYVVGIPYAPAPQAQPAHGSVMLPPHQQYVQGNIQGAGYQAMPDAQPVVVAGNMPVQVVGKVAAGMATAAAAAAAAVRGGGSRGRGSG